MKKIIAIALVILTFACSNSKLFTINGTTNISNNGSKVYLYDGLNQVVLDTTTVENGKFLFEINTETEKNIPIYAVELQNYFTAVIVEGEEVEIEMMDEKTTISGTKLNELYSNYISLEDRLFAKTVQIHKKLDAKYKNNLNSQKRINDAEKQLGVYEERHTAFVDSLYETNKNNTLGAILFINSALDVPIEELDEFMENNVLAKNDFVKQIYEYRKGVYIKLKKVVCSKMLSCKI